VSKVDGSKETSFEEKLRLLRMQSSLLKVLDSFLHCPTFPKDMSFFNKSKFFTLSLKLSTLTFSLLLRHHLLLGRHIFTKLRKR
jgi:hypothetical protein